MNIYLVGPLFSEAEAKQRVYEGEKIRKYLDGRGVSYRLFNPIEMELDGESTSAEIAMADYRGLSEADYVFLDLSSEDSGSCVALGLLIEMINNGGRQKLYPVFSDIRLERNVRSGLESTLGYNSMVVGIIKGHGITIYNSFEQAFKEFKKETGK